MTSDKRPRSLGLTSVGLQLLAVVNQGIVVEAKVDLDGCDCSLVVEGMHPEHILQLQEVHVGAQRHLPHAVGVKIKLVICDLHKMLMKGRQEDEGLRKVCPHVRSKQSNVGGEAVSPNTPRNKSEPLTIGTHPLNLVALLQSLPKLVHALVGQRTLRLEPHALHFVEVLHCRRSFLHQGKAKTQQRIVSAKSLW